MMTTNEAAARLNVTAEAIRKAIKRGRLKAEERETPRGTYYEIRPDDLAAYAASRLHVRQAA